MDPDWKCIPKPGAKKVAGSRWSWDCETIRLCSNVSHPYTKLTSLAWFAQQNLTWPSGMDISDRPVEMDVRTASQCKIKTVYGEPLLWRPSRSQRRTPSDLQHPEDKGYDPKKKAFLLYATRNKCIATSNRCLTSSNKNATSNKCLTSSNKKLVETSASLLVTGALLLVTKRILMTSYAPEFALAPAPGSSCPRSRELWPSVQRENSTCGHVCEIDSSGLLYLLLTSNKEHYYKYQEAASNKVHYYYYY